MSKRREVLECASVECMKELYSYAQPHIEWEDFLDENMKYSIEYNKWENFNKSYHNREKDPKMWEQYKTTFPDWENKSMKECVGPAPYSFYYLPQTIFKDIVDSYISAYKLDSQQELLDTIEILKDYCEKPIIDKWIEGENGFPGHRGYDHPDNLVTEITKILADNHEALNIGEAEKLRDKFFEFLDMAGNFYNWNRELNSFNTTVYLGASPNSNKEAVISNWKEFRNKDIEIDDKQIELEYYGEEED